jgi:hypothetical protein
MGHICFFGWFIWLKRPFDQVLNHTSNQNGQIFEMVYQDAHGLVKLAILISLANLFAMPNKLSGYLTYTYLCLTYLFT